MVNNEVQQRPMTNQTKTIYSFTFCWVLYQFAFFLISLFFPWSTHGNYFETSIGTFGGGEFFVFVAYFALVLLFMSLIFALISFLNEKKLFLNKFKILQILFSFPIVWFLWYLGWIVMSVSLGFWGFSVQAPTGVGFNLFWHTFYQGIEGAGYPNFLSTFSYFFIIFLLIFPWFILYRADDIKEKLDLKEKEVKNHLIKKNIQIFGWIGSIILTLGILICTIIAFFLPWSIYDNFITFLIAQFQNQNSGLFISLIIGLIIIIFDVILILLSIFSVKPWKKSARNKNQNNRDPLPNNKFNKLRIWWWFCWGFTWFILSTSIALFLIEEISFSGVGLILYVSSNYFTVMITSIVGMGVVFYFGGLQSKIETID